MKRLFAFALFGTLLVACGDTADTAAELTRLREDIDALKAATPVVEQPLVLLTRIDPSVEAIGAIRIPHCISYRFAGATQEKCRDVRVRTEDGLQARFQGGNGEITSCFLSAKIGSPLPDCWR